MLTIPAVKSEEHEAEDPTPFSPSSDTLCVEAHGVLGKLLLLLLLLLTLLPLLLLLFLLLLLLPLLLLLRSE